MILSKYPLGFQWPVSDPFLFFAYHKDDFPKGNTQLGPASSLEGRNIGMDFELKDGFRMYHGDVVPGFPVHPHRGFETITIVTEGYADHADSLGAAGRYGNGDVQWMTAGAGVQHSEMFPLLDDSSPNPLELFQIWLNLPKKDKFVPPEYKMFWAEKIPEVSLDNVTVRVIAGDWDNVNALSPPENSWASDPNNEVQIYLIKMEKGSELTLPASSADLMRTVYFYKGDQVNICGEDIAAKHAVALQSDSATVIKNEGATCEILFLQGRPISEPVVQQGPFVMNSRLEIMQAIQDYQKTHFGGWPWDRNDMVHGNEKRRFAQYADGSKEDPEDLP
tara:strand:+ start:113859 stop:114860 length:1002 start_codon:yes stop_codon:yes gene_type:complete